jgi:hypothetical protein
MTYRSACCCRGRRPCPSEEILPAVRGRWISPLPFLSSRFRRADNPGRKGPHGYSRRRAAARGGASLMSHLSSPHHGTCSLPDFTGAGLTRTDSPGSWARRRGCTAASRLPATNPIIREGSPFVLCGWYGALATSRSCAVAVSVSLGSSVVPAPGKSEQFLSGWAGGREGLLVGRPVLYKLRTGRPTDRPTLP